MRVGRKAAGLFVELAELHSESLGRGMNKLRKVITNTLNNVKVVQAIPLDYEVQIYDSSVLITETNIDGIITYTNRRFANVSGFKKEELIGAPHNIVRHPVMPRGVFKAMWKIISSKKIWRGYIKHLCKDGSFFWTLSYIQAKVDKDNVIIGYTSSSKIAYKNTREEVESKYRALRKDIDDKYFMASESYYETQIALRTKMNE